MLTLDETERKAYGNFLYCLCNFSVNLKLFPSKMYLKGKKKKPTLLIIDKIKTDLKSENKQKKISTKFIKKENKNCLHSL